MDSVFRSAREKLEKEHRESKENGKLKLEREKKDKEAAVRQRQAVEASQKARRIEAIESQMMKSESAERQRQDVEAYKRSRRRFEAIESQMMEDEDNLGQEDDIRRVGGEYIIDAIPPWMKTNMPQRIAQEGDDDVFEWDDDDEEGAKWEDAPGAGNCKRFILNVRAEKERRKKKKTTAAGKNTKS